MSSEERQGRLMLHPLAGSDLRTLAEVCIRNGGVRWSKIPHLAIVLGAVLGRLPFTLIERCRVERQMRRHEGIRAPLFIIGHWRSGTTHLYNTLSKSGRFAFVPPVAAGLPWDMLVMAKLFRPLLERSLPARRFIDQIPVTPDAPQEDEIAMANMQPVSFYHGLYFPKRFQKNFDRGVFLDGVSEAEIARWRRCLRLFLYKLAVLQDGKPLVIKNPVYTARVKRLRQEFPEARFIHIYRNPYVVYRSMKHFYTKLLRTVSLQDYRHLSLDQIVLHPYPRMMDLLLRDTADLGSERFVEVRYEDLESNPLSELERVYRQLDLGDFQADKDGYARYLDTVRQYRKNVYGVTAEENRRIYRHWSHWIDRWGYKPPEAATAGV